MTPPTVALVDDHALIVHAVSAALGDVGISCVPVAPRPVEDLVPAILETRPHLALVDLDLGAYGFATPVIKPLTDADIRVVVLTGETDHIRLAEALEAGAVRIVLKGAAFTDLVETIRRVTFEPGLKRDPQASALLAELSSYRHRQVAAQAAFDELTAREQETLTELAWGRTVHEIAARWVVAETTVRSHVRSILSKLGVQSQLQAVVKAVHLGWVDPDPGPLAQGRDASAADRAG